MDIAIDVTNTILETERLIIRTWQESDLDDFYAYASVPGVGEMAGWPHHQSIDTSRQILEKFMAGKNEFALYHKGDKKVIGSLGIHSSWANEDDEFKHLKLKEIGFVLSKAYWGQGLMPEAVKVVINYCFTQLGLDALTCGHFKSNPQSRRVIEKCGFKYLKDDIFYSNQLDKHFDDMKYILHKQTHPKG